MTALIVTESLFGNTLAIAEAIGSGFAEVHGPEAVRVLPARQPDRRAADRHDDQRQRDRVCDAHVEASR